MRRCDHCDFWEPGDGFDSDSGLCRRNAPAPVLVNLVPDEDLSMAVWWPETLADSWCGEFRPVADIPVKVDNKDE